MIDNIIRFPLILAAVFVAGLGDVDAAPSSTNIGATNRILLIAPSSMPIAAGKATLTIGELHRTGGVYTGEYKIKLFPYIFKNEKGRLEIIVSDESMAAINEGKVAAIIGTATTSGKNGKSRHIDATATPTDVDHGTLKLWFMAGDRKMTFNPSYHFSESLIVNAAGIKAETNFASSFSHGRQ